MKMFISCDVNFIPLKKKKLWGTSLVHLAIQGTWIQSLVWEDSTCCGAPKLVCHND